MTLSCFTSKHIDIITVFISLFALSFTYYNQYFLNIQPCELCLYQRYPLGILLCFSFILFFKEYYFLRVLLLLVSISGLGLSSYQWGIEQHWWPAPAFCQTSYIPHMEGLSQEEKLRVLKDEMNKNTQKSFVPCDQIRWKIWGISAVLWSILLYALLSIMGFFNLWIRKH